MKEENQVNAFSQKPVIETFQRRCIKCHRDVKTIRFGNKGVIGNFERTISIDQWARNQNGLKGHRKCRIQKGLAVKTVVSFIHLFTHALIYPIDKLNKLCLCTRHCARY